MLFNQLRQERENKPVYCFYDYTMTCLIASSLIKSLLQKIYTGNGRLFCKWPPYFMSKKLGRARGSGGLFLLLPEYTFHSNTDWKEDIKGPSALSLLPSGQNFHPTNWGWIKEEIPELSAAFVWKRISAWNGPNGGILLSLCPPTPNWDPVALPWKWGEEEAHAFGFTNPKGASFMLNWAAREGRSRSWLKCHLLLFSCSVMSDCL